MTARSALFSGTVIHRRFGVKSHALRYRMVMLLLDLDEIAALDTELRFFSRNRFNLFSFRDSDYRTGQGTLRQDIEAHLARADIVIPGGAIRLLSAPRVLGYAFNPLSVYFCYAANERLVAILYEVHNTFKQRHTYLIPVADQDNQDRGVVSQSCEKVFYVSPFMDMDMTYAFRVVPPGPDVSIAIDAHRNGGRIIAASFAGAARPLTDGVLLRTFIQNPLMSLAVISGIHWEALKLWMKGIGLRKRPAPPAQAISIINRKKA